MTKERSEILLGILIVIAVCTGVYYLAPTNAKVPRSPVVRSIDTAPLMTPTLAVKIAASTGFDYLVSYTERGFEPANVTIEAGQTIRFANNNAGKTLWVAATSDGGTLYAGSGRGCGQSDFDSCMALERGDFWEFTFQDEGTWSYKNNTEVKHMGVVTVL